MTTEQTRSISTHTIFTSFPHLLANFTICDTALVLRLYVQFPGRSASRCMYLFRYCGSAKIDNAIGYRARREAVNGHAQKSSPCVRLIVLLFGLAEIFGMHIVPMQEQVLALFATLLASSFLTPSFVPKSEMCFVQSHVQKLPYVLHRFNAHSYVWHRIEPDCAGLQAKINLMLSWFSPDKVCFCLSREWIGVFSNQ